MSSPLIFCLEAVTIGELRKRILNRLTGAVGAAEARAMERMILEDVMLTSPAAALANPEREMPDFMPPKINAIVDRICSGEPIQYVLGRARFYGMELRVDPNVLIPRPETAQLVDIIVDRAGGRPDLRVLDLGTGSGCIALALARTLRFPQVTAVDISAAALEVARGNAMALGAKVDFRRGDILNLNEIGGEWDIIVSNPPYVLESERAAMEPTVLDHEPQTALFVPDSDPMRFYSPVIDFWKRHGAPGSMLFFEINPLCASEFKGAEILRDSFGKNRFAIYGKKGTD